MIATRFPTTTNDRGVAELAETAKRIEALLTDAVGLLSMIAQRESRESKQAMAIRLLAERGAGNLTELARDVGVSRATLYNWPAFREALDRVKGSSYWQLRQPRAARGSQNGELAE